MQLYCDNEHGCGDVIFPDDGVFNMNNVSAPIVRRQAFAAGWGRHNRADYCPGCMDAINEEKKGRR
jgi:hypothetical protein